jgi:hypothetical protein
MLPASIMTTLTQPLLWLLERVHTIGFTWAWSIIVLTFIVRTALVPLTVKQQQSMRRMTALQPELKKLQQKYKHDRQLLNEKMMEFYRENNTNPFGSCLPIVVQKKASRVGTNSYPLPDAVGVYWPPYASMSPRPTPPTTSPTASTIKPMSQIRVIRGLFICFARFLDGRSVQTLPHVTIACRAHTMVSRAPIDSTEGSRSFNARGAAEKEQDSAPQGNKEAMTSQGDACGPV